MLLKYGCSNNRREARLVSLHQKDEDASLASPFNSFRGDLDSELKRRRTTPIYAKTQNAPAREKTRTSAKRIVNSIKLNCQFILIAVISRRWVIAFFDRRILGG